MKKTLFAFLITILLFTFVGCRDNIKTCAGKIKNMTDTTIVANMGDYDITFDIKKAEVSNGAVMPNDSVLIHYVGDLSEKKATALVIKLIPHKGNVVEAIYNPNKKLETKPMTKEEVKENEEFVKAAKRGH